MVVVNQPNLNLNLNFASWKPNCQIFDYQYFQLYYSTTTMSGDKIACTCVHKSKLCSVCEQGVVDLGQSITLPDNYLHYSVVIYA